GDIPEYIEVDMQKVETGQIVHLSDVALPAGVVSVALSLGEDHDLAVASVLSHSESHLQHYLFLKMIGWVE
ncbi:MAG: hypothetical protein F6K48_15610, partial [Okeania sp. SIO3H1]|nr:hypothetical protein [Okeania sp. SIO3H1]